MGIGLGFAGRAISAFDSDAINFFSRAGISNAGQKTAINTLVAGLKAQSLWTLLYALYPFIGGTSASHAENLKSSSYQISWVNAPTQNANGVTFNGSTQYGICSGLSGNSVVPHLSGQTVYLRTTSSEATGVQKKLCGISDAGSTILYTLEYVDNAGIERNRGCVGAVAGLVADGTPPIAQKKGTLSVNRTSTSSMKGYHNGSEFLNYAGVDTSTPPTLEYWVGAMNLNTTMNGPCPENFALYAVHQGLTLAQVGNLTTLILNYQTSLGRNV